jgi:glycosyltransferase involved in cell wall biosynthesis
MNSLMSALRPLSHRIPPKRERPLIVHIITDLMIGGAEVMLVRLLEDRHMEEYEHCVIALKSPEPLASELRQMGHKVYSISSDERWRVHGAWELRQLLSRLQPDLAQTWMIHANLVGGLASRAAVHSPVHWGIHMGKVPVGGHGRTLAWLQRAEAVLSYVVPEQIVSCSATSKLEMTRKHYRADRIEVIMNGFDTDRFAPDPAQRAAGRSELGVAPGDFLAAHVSRWHPHKDQATLIAGARRALSTCPSLHVVLCGAGLTRTQTSIKELAHSFPGRIHPLGSVRDVRPIYQAADLLVSSSSSEAFPLVVGEAMASGTPVLATDCGDSRQMVDDTGVIIPVEDAAALGAALEAFAFAGPSEASARGERARRRVISDLSLSKTARQYGSLWRRSLRHGEGKAPHPTK